MRILAPLILKTLEGYDPFSAITRRRWKRKLEKRCIGQKMVIASISGFVLGWTQIHAMKRIGRANTNG